MATFAVRGPDSLGYTLLDENRLEITNLYEIINADSGETVGFAVGVVNANSIAGALNFNTRPDDYGYVLDIENS